MAVAERPERFHRLGQVLGLEHRPDPGAADMRTDVVQAAERGTEP